MMTSPKFSTWRPNQGTRSRVTFQLFAKVLWEKVISRRKPVVTYKNGDKVGHFRSNGVMQDGFLIDFFASCFSGIRQVGLFMS